MPERCEKCQGVGYERYDADPGLRLHCECPMGRDLRRVDARSARAVALVLSELEDFNSAMNRRARLLFDSDYKLRASGDVQ